MKRSELFPSAIKLCILTAVINNVTNVLYNIEWKISGSCSIWRTKKKISTQTYPANRQIIHFLQKHITFLFVFLFHLSNKPLVWNMKIQNEESVLLCVAIGKDEFIYIRLEVDFYCNFAGLAKPRIICIASISLKSHCHEKNPNFFKRVTIVNIRRQVDTNRVSTEIRAYFCNCYHFKAQYNWLLVVVLRCWPVYVCMCSLHHILKPC